MACLLAPVAEAVVTTIITKAVKSKEAKREALKIDTGNNSFEADGKIPFSRKLKWLNNMLWGGSALLAFEHFWHGEIVPWYPFLTAASDPAQRSIMLSELVTVGVTMSVLVTAVWSVMLFVSKAMEKKYLEAKPASN